MTDTANPETPAKNRPFSACSLSFCTVAKILVAIPALPLAAIAASALFENPLLRLIASVATVMTLVFAAIQIDRMPFFAKMVVKRECKSSDKK